MTYRYSQSTGAFSRNGTALGVGYSGHGDAKNDPSRESEARVGPLPRGLYYIGAAREHPTLGPCVLRLDPVPGQQMFGRSGFLIHGDSRAAPGAASLGCIILPPHIRSMVDAGTDRWLEVMK